MYGIPPPALITYIPGTSRVAAVDTYLHDRDAILLELRSNLLRAQGRMRSFADRHRRDLTFEVGTYVLVKLQPYRQQTVVSRSSMKLAPRFFGPYQILEKIRPAAYRLALPSGSLIHDVFHVSLLRKHFGPVPAVRTPLPIIDAETSTVLPQPEAILDR